MSPELYNVHARRGSARLGSDQLQRQLAAAAVLAVEGHCRRRPSLYSRMIHDPDDSTRITVEMFKSKCKCTCRSPLTVGPPRILSTLYYNVALQLIYPLSPHKTFTPLSPHSPSRRNNKRVEEREAALVLDVKVILTPTCIFH